MKRVLSVLIVFLFTASSVFAQPELWVGAGALTGRDYVSSGIKTELVNDPEIFENNLYNKGNFSFLNQLGPYYELLFFPYDKIKIGLYGAGNTSFVTGIDNKGYRSINLDLRQNARIGICYNQFFGSYNGIFTDIAYDYSWYRFATSNKSNSKETPNYKSMQQSAFYVDFGYLGKFEKSYYKIGFAFRKPFGNEMHNAFSLDILLSGGVYF